MRLNCIDEVAVVGHRLVTNRMWPVGTSDNPIRPQVEKGARDGRHVAPRGGRWRQDITTA